MVLKERVGLSTRGLSVLCSTDWATLPYTKFFFIDRKKNNKTYFMAGMENFEISTFRLTADCSASELHARVIFKNGASRGIRTLTVLYQRILSPQRLPFRHRSKLISKVPVCHTPWTPRFNTRLRHLTVLLCIHWSILVRLSLFTTEDRILGLSMLVCGVPDRIWTYTLRVKVLRATHYTNSLSIWSRWQDSNLRPTA